MAVNVTSGASGEVGYCEQARGSEEKDQGAQKGIPEEPQVHPGELGEPGEPGATRSSTSTS